MHHERVSENVYWFQSDVYAQVTAGVVVGPQWAVVIDTLALPDETLGMREFIEHELGVPVRYVVNTHYHADHTFGNQLLASRTGAKTVMHELDDDLFTTEEAKAWAAAFGLSAAPPVDIRITDGYRLPLGKLTLEFIHTPGHTPGAVCVLVENNLITGDTLFVGAVGRTDLPGGSMETLLKSIEEKLLPLPDDTVVWPGHDYGDQPTSTMGREKETNPYITDFILDK